MTMVCVLGALAVVLTLLFQRAPACAPPECGGSQVLDLPPTTLRYGDGDPVVVVALFVDLTSPVSRQLFAVLTEAAEGSRLGERSALFLLHAPLADCAANEAAYACVASRSVECAEKLSPGAGVRMAGAAFDLQWEAPTEQSLAGLVSKAAALGLEVDGLRRCVREDAEVRGRVAAHATWARERGLSSGSAGFIVARGEPERVAVFHGWLTRGSLLRSVRCLVYGACKERRS